MSDLAATLAYQLRCYGRGDFVTEHRFHPTRKFRLDLAYVDHKLGIEVNGGNYTRGRHTRPAALRNEYEKRRLAQMLGWWVLDFDTKDVEEGVAALEICKALELREKEMED